MRSMLMPAIVLFAMSSCGGGGDPWPDRATGPSTVTLTMQQRRVADQLVNIFEYGTPVARYDAVEALGDGRGYTCGKIGFTTSSTEVRDLIEAYTAKVPDSPIRRHLPRLRQLAASGSADTDGLSGFAEDWAAAAGDATFRAEQDGLADRLTFTPALELARRLGIRTPLGVTVLYDTAIQHGLADDPDGLPALVDRANRDAHGAPADGVAEQAWLRAFLSTRAETLRHPHDEASRPAWAESVGRVDTLRDLVDRDLHQLTPPVDVTAFGDPFTLR